MAKDGNDIRDKGYMMDLESALSSIEGRWKTHIITTLARSSVPLRFNQILQAIPGISPRLLTVSLRELEKDCILVREVISETPKNVQYSLSSRGLFLIPIFDQLAEWNTLGYSGVVSFDSGVPIKDSGLNARSGIRAVGPADFF